MKYLLVFILGVIVGLLINTVKRSKIQSRSEFETNIPPSILHQADTAQMNYEMREIDSIYKDWWPQWMIDLGKEMHIQGKVDLLNYEKYRKKRE